MSNLERKKPIRNRTRDLNPYLIEGAGVIDYFKNVFGKNTKFTNSTQSVLDKYGNFPVVGIQILRQPIVSAIDTALNVISLGTWQNLKNKYSFDSLFHLFSIITVKLPNGERKNLLLEKNQSINASEKIPGRNKDTEVLTIALPTKINYTINSLLENTHKAVGSDRFFIYRPFNDSNNGGNCQDFIINILKSNNLLGDRYATWILQDIEPLVKGLPQYVKTFSKGITDFASMGEKLIGGEQPKHKSNKNKNKYLGIVRLIASSYGYNPKDIKLANDGKHKLIVEHDGKIIKFGKDGMKDFILYFLETSEANAIKHRHAYLKRSDKIKGNWRNDKYSKNNLARNILWMAPRVKGGSFNQIESDLKKIGTGNNIKDVVGNSISDYELKKYLPDANLVMYPDLKKYKNIEDLLSNDKNYCIILYLEEPNSGHYVSLKRNGNVIEFFCSYGSKIDEPLTWYSEKVKKELGEDIPYLTNLLNKTKLDVVYNDVDYQGENTDIVTCGRHVIFNLINFITDGLDLKKYYQLMSKLKKKEKMNYDDIVSKYVNLILD